MTLNFYLVEESVDKKLRDSLGVTGGEVGNDLTEAVVYLLRSAFPDHKLIKKNNGEVQVSRPNGGKSRENSVVSAHIRHQRVKTERPAWGPFGFLGIKSTDVLERRVIQIYWEGDAIDFAELVNFCTKEALTCE